MSGGYGTGCLPTFINIEFIPSVKFDPVTGQSTKDCVVYLFYSNGHGYFILQNCILQDFFYGVFADDGCIFLANGCTFKNGITAISSWGTGSSFEVVNSVFEDLYMDVAPNYGCNYIFHTCQFNVKNPDFYIRETNNWFVNSRWVFRCMHGAFGIVHSCTFNNFESLKGDYFLFTSVHRTSAKLWLMKSTFNNTNYYRRALNSNIDAIVQTGDFTQSYSLSGYNAAPGQEICKFEFFRSYV